MRSAAKRPMSAAKQFKAGVTSVSDPSGWRGGLVRSRARRRWVGMFSDLCKYV